VISAIERMRGGEVFVPKIPSMRLLDLAEAIAPGCALREIGVRPGEKLHEVLISEDEARNTLELDDRYLVTPSFSFHGATWNEGRRLGNGFRYASDTNTRWLSGPELLQLAGILHEPHRAESVVLQ
jgi:UDP-N-acetylglucosamine 4,6-dehydratase